MKKTFYVVFILCLSIDVIIACNGDKCGEWIWRYMR